MLRVAFIRDVARRFRRLRRAIRELVEEEDAFGLRPRRGGTLDRVLANAGLVANVVRKVGGAWYVYSKGGRRLTKGYATRAEAAKRLRQIEFFKRKPTTNTRWAFQTDDQKLDSYREWLKEQVDSELLGVDPGNVATPWVQPYLTAPYKKGMLRAYADTHKMGGAIDFVEGGRKAFLEMAFDAPVAQSKLKILGTRAFSQLRGVTAQMDQDMSRILAQGLAQGKGARSLARDLQKNVTDLERKRARTIARTEIIHAHNEGQLDAFEAMNVEGVGVLAEWNTAHDDLVCPLCQPLEGIVLTIKEARGMLPRHPNCRCAWIPAGVGEHKGGTTKTTHAGKGQGLAKPGTAPTGKTTGQVFSKEGIESRLLESIKKEHPRLGARRARAASRWVGADRKVTGKLKPGSRKFKEAKKAVKEKVVAAAKQAATKKAASASRAVRSSKTKEGVAVPTVPVEALKDLPDLGTKKWERGWKKIDSLSPTGVAYGQDMQDDFGALLGKAKKEKTLKTVDISPGDFIPTQDAVLLEDVERVITDFDPKKFGSVVAVRINGGKAFLTDGHHRWAAARLAGHDTVKTRVLDLDLEDLPLSLQNKVEAILEEIPV